jgi:murein DD-endopeptidase MepM/ murein hydrolase activator NlpD
MNPYNRTVIILTAVIMILFPASDTGVSGAEEQAVLQLDKQDNYTLSVYPSEAVPGEIVKITINGVGDKKILAEGYFGKQELIFHPGGSEKEFFSLAGVNLGTKPGKISITVLIREGKGEAQTIRDKIVVKEKEFSLQKLYLEEKEYTPELLDRIRRDGEKFKSIWNTISSERLWTQAFRKPLKMITVTSDFGLRRLINDVPRQSHTGIDLRAAQGDTIFASNSGRVVLLEELYFSGRTVVLDHGEGLYSMYFHLSSELVSHGEYVDSRQPIGLAGSTGRATGPHLHWGIILRGARLDPLKILELPI